MTIETLVWKGGEAIISAAAGTGASIIVKEAVDRLTPENLNKIQEYCVECLKFGGTATVAAGAAWGVHKKMENAKKICDKVISVFDKADKAEAEPVIAQAEEDNIVEIDEDDEIPVVELD